MREAKHDASTRVQLLERIKRKQVLICIPKSKGSLVVNDWHGNVRRKARGHHNEINATCAPASSKLPVKILIPPSPLQQAAHSRWALAHSCLPFLIKSFRTCCIVTGARCWSSPCTLRSRRIPCVAWHRSTCMYYTHRQHMCHATAQQQQQAWRRQQTSSHAPEGAHKRVAVWIRALRLGSAPRVTTHVHLSHVHEPTVAAQAQWRWNNPRT